MEIHLKQILFQTKHVLILVLNVIHFNTVDWQIKKNSNYLSFLIERYGIDTDRYFFVRKIIFGCDGEFISERFIKRINNDLSNQLGNLFNLTVKVIDKKLVF